MPELIHFRTVYVLYTFHSGLRKIRSSPPPPSPTHTPHTTHPTYPTPNQNPKTPNPYSPTVITLLSDIINLIINLLGPESGRTDSTVVFQGFKLIVEGYVVTMLKGTWKKEILIPRSWTETGEHILFACVLWYCDYEKSKDRSWSRS